MAQRYRPLFKLDAGGMAEVYVAEAESVAGFKKKVAIKRIRPDLAGGRFVRMFLDEARLSLHLNHANIVSVFDIGKSDETYFIVMEYIDGTTLKGLLEYMVKSRGVARIDIPLTVWILNEVLKGLDYAHGLRDPETQRSLGIVHRDVSPPNILLSWNGEVKLSDFGLAKAVTQLESTDPGIVKGKFSYLSPEAANGVEVDHRADLFAVGILGFEMVTGQRLFLRENDYETVAAVRRAEIPDIRAIYPAIPPELERILRRSLARDPAGRYRSAGQMSEDLLQFLFSHGLKVSTRELAELLSQLRQLKTAQRDLSAGHKLILDLIDDELLNFRSIEASGGASPLSTLAGGRLDLIAGYDPAAPLEPQEFAGAGAAPGPAPPPDASPRAAPIDAATFLRSPAPRSPFGPAQWVGLLAVLAGASGALYWLFR